MVEVFKTNVDTKRAAGRLAMALIRQFRFTSVNFDLNDCDRILRIENELAIDVDRVIRSVRCEGVEIEVLPD